jgi:nitrate/nitrite transport system substrate-binding protein
VQYLQPRLEGHIELGDGLGTKTFGHDGMVFFRDGAVNAPRHGHAIWALAQFQRVGLLKETPDYRRLADEILMRDLYLSVAQKEGINVPDDDMAPIRIKLDNATFDPAKPADEVRRP